jgi:hypothetical protein
MQGITTRYQEVQQDILETFVDRGELRTSVSPPYSPMANAFLDSNWSIPDNWP